MLIPEFCLCQNEALDGFFPSFELSVAAGGRRDMMLIPEFHLPHAEALNVFFHRFVQHCRPNPKLWVHFIFSIVFVCSS